MKILLYGGHFDPITKAHMDIAFFGRNYTDYDAVWFLPSYKKSFPNDNTEDKGACSSDRIKMIELAIDNIDGFRCCDFEIENELTGGTYSTVIRLRYKYPGHVFGLLTGSDNANTIRFWNHWESMINGTRFIIVHRYNYPVKNPLMWLKNGRHIIISREAFTSDKASSTLVRRNIKRGYWTKSTRTQHVAKPVLDYILERSLYK